MSRTIGEPTPTRKYRVRVTTEERFEFVVDAQNEDLAEDIARDRARPGWGERVATHCHAELLEEGDDARGSY